MTLSCAGLCFFPLFEFELVHNQISIQDIPGLTRPVDIRNSLTMELSSFALIELLTAEIKHN